MPDDINQPRIKIRYKRISDARNDFSWQTDPELARLDAADPLTMSFQQFLSEFTFDLCYPSSSRHEFAIETPEGQHIGNCVYYNMNQAEGKTELGIMIGNRDYWNKGYGVETVNTLVDHIFNRTTLERVYLTTLDWNQRAQKCFKKCGFQECGEVVRDAHTFILMAIHRAEWQIMRESEAKSDPVQTPK
jgi:RimJ/RimL family protein N-acetyltransferase